MEPENCRRDQELVGRYGKFLRESTVFGRADFCSVLIGGYGRHGYPRAAQKGDVTVIFL